MVKRTVSEPISATAYWQMIFFTAAQLSLSFYAKSFKEAQSIISRR